MRTVLVTGAGSTAASLFCSLALGRGTANTRVIACDSTPHGLNVTSRFVRDYLQVPPYENPDYLPTIVEVCKRFDVNYFVPHTESEAVQVLRGTNALSALGIDSPVAPLEVYESLRQKSSVARLMSQCGIPTIQTLSQDQIVADKTYILKPNVGFGGQGVRFVSGKEAIACLESSSDVIIQEVVDGPEFTVEVFSFHGRISSVVRERRATRGGISSVARFSNVPLLHDYVAEIARKYELPILSNFQFMRVQQDGSLLLSDANLRVAAGTGLSRAAGWDGLGALVTIATDLGDPWTHFPKAHPSGDAFRRYEDVFFPGD